MPNPEQPSLIIPVAFAQAVVNYLGARPYREVCDLMAGMGALAPLPPSLKADPVGEQPAARRSSSAKPPAS